MSLFTRTDTQDDNEIDAPVETIGEPKAIAEHSLEVRRRAGLAVALGAGASLVAIAYLARAVAHGGALDWALAVVLGAVGVVNLAGLLDARTPLLVADDLGIRLRLGRTWVGLPWGGLDLVEHRPRHGLLRDGVVVLRPRYPHRVLEDLDPSARRWARVATRLHGAPLAVPLGLATRVVGGTPDVTAALRALSANPDRVVELETDAAADVDTVDTGIADAGTADAGTADAGVVDDEISDTETAHDDAEVSPRRLPDPRPAVAHLIGILAARLGRTTSQDEDEDEDEDEDDDDDEIASVDEILPSATPEPARTTVVAARAEVRRESRVELADPDETQSWSEHELTLARSHEVAHEPLVIDDLDSGSASSPSISPSISPVIGPQFARARTRLGLTVDELAERTRIRPHVIEAIEIDDFSACGGDFYARGHVRTLARVLGVEVVALLATYDEEYADAPIDPRRVFEAELAGAGSIRATRGGPNWSVLVAAVMALVLCWSIARLLTDGPAQLPDRAFLSGSGGPNHSAAAVAKPVPVVLDASAGGARVVVRDGAGKVVFTGNLSFGQKHTLQVSPPVRIQTTDGSLSVTVAGQARGHVGTRGRTASASYVVRP